MTFTASELDPPLARWPDVAHIAEEGCRCSSSFPSYASRSGSHFFFRLENRLFDFRLPSRDELIDRTRRIIESFSLARFPRTKSRLPFLFLPRLPRSILVIRNAALRSNFTPLLVNGRVQPENQATTLSPLPPTIPRPVRPRELLPPRSSRLNDAASRPFRHSRRGLTSTINGQTIA